jgi:drug/metabolite transporter (DMT)-like permease
MKPHPGIARWMMLSVGSFALMNLTVKFLTGIPVTELVFFRSAVSLVLCIVPLWRAGIPLWGTRKDLLIARGIFGTISLTTFFYTLQYLPLGTALTLQYLSPIFTTLLGVWLLKERAASLQWLLFLISFLGVLVIRGFDSQVSTPLLLAGIGSAFSSAWAYIMIRKAKDTEHPLVIILYFPLVAIPAMVVLTWNHWVMPMGWQWLGLLLMGIFTQGGQYFMTKAYQAAPVSKVAIFKYTGILFALGFDFWLFDAVYSPWVLLGIGLVVAGIIPGMLKKPTG